MTDEIHAAKILVPCARCLGDWHLSFIVCDRGGASMRKRKSGLFGAEPLAREGNWLALKNPDGIVFRGNAIFSAATPTVITELRNE